MVPLILLGLAIKGISGLFGANARRREGQAEAMAARLNAQQVRARTGIETTLRTRQGVREAGSINAAAGSLGSAGGGSAADILAESARNTAFDLDSIRTQGDLEARVYDTKAKAAKKAGRRGFFGGLLSTAAGLLG